MHWLKIAALSAALCVGCKPERAAPTSTPAPAASSVAHDFGPEPYPRARWRLAPLTELDSVVLWVSHVLIRHEEVSDARASFQLAGWELELPQATRSRRQALELAEIVANDARGGQDFGELARRYSDDLSTAANGGSLHGITGPHLWPWPNVLDALATLEPGGVSRVVETQYGFHVFKLEAAPPEATVSGLHIVIAHDSAPGLDAVARRKVPSRSRQEALALAAQIYEQARAAPSDFAQLAERYSDHQDAARGGDFGSWSTHEPTGLYREVELLSRLAVGEIAPPIDTPYGLQIFQRTPNRPRKEYAMVKLQLRFDPTLPDSDPSSRSSAYGNARQLAALLREHPARFSALQTEYCCPRPIRVVEGRDLPALEAALATLTPGQVGSEPIADPVEFLIPKRLELSALPERPKTRFALPSPAEPDLRYLLSRAPSLASELVVAAREAALALGLPTQTSSQLAQQQTVPADFEQQTLSARLQILDGMEKALGALLEPDTLSRYRALVAGHFEQLILRAQSDSD
ncbi:MAG TPA: peptidylprolyl isomerase [Polyangiaceae bacterium]|nr:peptidylprolyl isomerase [Polyangiaceae bacterium]